MAETWTWITAAGTSHRLDGKIDHCIVEDGVRGRGAPPVRYARETTPGEPGSQLVMIEHDIRTIELPLLIDGSSQAALVANVRAWIDRLDPTEGDGILQIATNGGDTRQITARCMNGLDIYEKLGEGTFSGYLRFAAEFEADPYWTDTADTLASWSVTAGTPFFPFFPLRLSNSEIFATATITNVGDEETRPVWEFQGPAGPISLTHLPTGRKLTWSGTLGLGEILTIDTRRSNESTTPQSVTLQDGSNRFSELTAWDFWPLSVGTQTVQIEMAGATTDSLASARWRPLYRSGY